MDTAYYTNIRNEDIWLEIVGFRDVEETLLIIVSHMTSTTAIPLNYSYNNTKIPIGEKKSIYEYPFINATIFLLHRTSHQYRVFQYRYVYNQFLLAYHV